MNPFNKKYFKSILPFLNIPLSILICFFSIACNREIDLSALSKTDSNKKSLNLSQKNVQHWEDLSKFSELKILEANFTKLTAIPSSVNSLSKLEILNLYGNDITSVENLDFRSLPNLEVLLLGANSLKQLSPNLKQAKKLRILSLDRNPITITREDWEILSGLENLETLDLSESKTFINFPDVKTAPPKLKNVKLFKNRLNKESKTRMVEVLPNVKIDF